MESVLKQISNEFEEFIRSFRDEKGKLLYFEKVGDMIREEKRSLEVSYQHIRSYDRELSEVFMREPQRFIEEASKALSRIVALIDYEYSVDKKFHVRIIDPPKIHSFKDLNLILPGKLICLSGIVTRCTPVLRLLEEAAFRCTNPDCGHIMRVKQVGTGLKKPVICEECNSNKFELDENLSSFINWQVIRIQEKPEELSPGAMPRYVDCVLLDDIVDEVKPGDRATVIGILDLLRESGKRFRGRGTLYTSYIKVNNIIHETKEYEKIEVTEEDKKRFMELAKDRERLKEAIIRSIAPSIHNWDYIKRAIALALFGGNPKIFEDGTRVKGEINILLVGDPGTAKCVTGESMIVMDDGSIERIDKIVNDLLSKDKIPLDDGHAARGDLKIKTMNMDGKVGDASSTVVLKRKSHGKILRVKTKTGRTIRVTPTHPFFTCRNGKITKIKASELKPRMFIATPYYIPRKENCGNAGLAAIAGYLIASGKPSRKGGLKGVVISCPEGLVNAILYLAKKNLSNVKIDVNREGFKAEVSIYSPDIERLLDQCEIYKRKKTVPAFVMSGSLDETRAFLRAFFDVAGKLSIRRGEMYIVSASRDFIEQMRHLLLSHRIIAVVEDEGNCIRLKVRGRYIKRFIEEVGTAYEARLKTLKRISRKVSPNTNPRDVIPGVGRLIRDARQRLAVSTENFKIPKTSLQRYESGKRPIPRETLRSIVETLKENLANPFDIPQSLRELEIQLNADIYWDEVVSISEENSKEWVYDIQVEKTHNFIANGIFVHNSQILKYVSQLAPRGLYTTGKGATAAGLTAAVVRDPFTGGWSLEAGALVIADGGIACIDEFDKMGENDRVAIHEAMEQQTISVAKAGIISTLNARTTIIAAANPKGGRWISTKSVAENINLPPTILSRFDLIFVMEDRPDIEKDRAIAEHIVDTHIGVNPMARPIMDSETLKKYIAFARRIRPKVSRKAAERIKEYYLTLRMQTPQSEAMYEGEAPIPITPRQLEALIRLAEAHAKMLLKETVDIEDAEAAIELMNYMLKTVAYDVSIGGIDIHMLSGYRHSKMLVSDIIMEKARELSKGKEEGVSRVELIKAVMEELNVKRIRYTEKMVKELIDELRETGNLYMPKAGYFKPAEES